ncbi:MAG: Sec-independent protein translocase protein TatB [Gammaproteobacteria bacterium]|nr:Sec-independent protein translocase protein TatB [Gammaproteobacteria bacterium]
MFDIGFWELSLIGIVALLVIGPERLPAVARTVGKWVGKANRFVANVKDDISKELKDEDLKRILVEQQKLADEYKQAANSMKSSVQSGTESLRESVHMDDLLVIDEPESSDTSGQKEQHKPAAERQSDSGNNTSEQHDTVSDTRSNTTKS